MAADDEDLERTSRLLTEVFPDDPRFRDPRYLHWLYRGPAGEVVATNEDSSDGRRLGHYAVVPQPWTGPGGRTADFGLSLNTAVHPAAQGRGLFTTLAERTYEDARTRGLAAIVGVANANSTPGFLRRLGFRHLGQLPARFCLPRPLRHLPDTFDGSSVDRCDVGRPLLPHEPTAWRQDWTWDRLRWRLSAPAARFALHVDEHALAVSTRTKRGLPVAVLLAVFPRGGEGEVDGSRYVTAACLAHRAPVAVYAGWSRWVRLDGVPLPQRLRPSPLNLIVRTLGPGAGDQDAFQLERFEFIDFDAY